MENSGVVGFLIITLNCNVTLVGKVWLIFTILLRLGVLIGAGYPIFQDEQERFICNTLQPGCAAVCFDLFSPVSPPRFWLLQSLSVLLPGAAFGVYAVHRGAQLAARGRPRVPDLSAAYAAQLALRTGLEAASAAAQYLLLGLGAPARFPCARPPCAGTVACYVSRPTERSLAALYAWAACALSLLLSIADLGCSLRRCRTRRGTGVQAADCQGQELGIGAQVADRLGSELGTRPQVADCPSAELGTGPQVADCPSDDLGTRALVADCPGAELGTRPQVAHCPGAELGTRPQVADCPRQAELPGAAESEAWSSAEDGSARPPRERRGPGAPRSQLATLHPSRRVSSGSAPHLRAHKSEWV